jgi:hypothetical protein
VEGQKLSQAFWAACYALLLGHSYANWAECLIRDRERERATQRGRVLTSSVGLWEGPLGARITQRPHLEVPGKLGDANEWVSYS